MDPIAKQLNQIIENGNPHIMELLSEIGKNLFFPKGILSQSAEAKEKAHNLNATIGIATENGKTMYFPSVMDSIDGILPEEGLTYAPSFGLLDLRKTWQKAQKEKNPSISQKETSLPVVTCGITHAIAVFADMWVDPGDDIIFPDMMWGNYNLILGVRKGAKITHYPLFSEDGGFNMAAFEKKLIDTSKTNNKLIVFLNFPNNPTGYTVSEEEGNKIIQILTSIAGQGTNVIVVSDDAYFGLFYEEETLKESIFARLCDLHPRILAIKLDGATKENYVWGLRVGFVTYGSAIEDDPVSVYDALAKKTAGCVRGSISNASHLSQSIVLKSMQAEKYQTEKKEKFAILKKRANCVKEVLKNPKYNEAWDFYPFNSGYFMCIKLKSVDAEKLRVHLLEKYGVGLISIGARNLRIAFSCLDEKNIPELFDTILKGEQELKAYNK